MPSKDKATASSRGRVPLKWGEGTTELNSNVKKNHTSLFPVKQYFPFLNHMAVYLLSFFI